MRKSEMELDMDYMLTVSHFRAVAAKRLSDGYEGASIMLAFALDYWHDSYSDAPDYRNVWCGIVWC